VVGPVVLVTANYWQLLRRFPEGGGAAAAAGRAFGPRWIFLPIGALVVAADGPPALQSTDSGTADPDWVSVVDGTALRPHNADSGKVLGVRNMSTADNASVLQRSDNGTADHRPTHVEAADRPPVPRNANSGRVLGIAGDSPARGALAVQVPDTGSPTSRCWFVPTGTGTSGTWAAGSSSGCSPCRPPTART
jgi:hypothetical protein